MKAKSKRSALFRTLTLLLVLVFLLTYASFSWIKREWSPKIGQENVSIATSGALVFQLTEFGDEVTTSKTINEILGVTDFSLKPVSSVTGSVGEFFTINYADEVGDETFKHLNATKEGVTSETALGIRFGFIVLNFKLMLATVEGDNARRFVYLTKGSHIMPSEGSSNDVTSAIRISIHSDQMGFDPIIIGTPEAVAKDCLAVTNEKDGLDNYIADGEKMFDEYLDDGDSVRNLETESGSPLLLPQSIRTLADYDCVDDQGVFRSDECLFEIDPRSAINVTVCIWLEGEDPMCNDLISDDQINLLLQFAARTVEES